MTARGYRDACPGCAALREEVSRLRARRVVRLRVAEWSVGSMVLNLFGVCAGLLAAGAWVDGAPVAARLGAVAGVLLVLAVLLRLRVSVQRAGDPQRVRLDDVTREPLTPGWYTVTSRSGVEWTEHVYSPEERKALDIGNLPLGRPR